MRFYETGNNMFCSRKKIQSNGWSYVSKMEKSSGYEDVLNEIKQYTHEEYVEASRNRRNQMVEEIFNIYRSKNIFPIWYYNKQGLVKEVQKCIKKQVEDNWGKILGLKFNQGSSLCKFLMPNLHKVISGNNLSKMFKFYNDKELKKAIHFCLQYDKNVIPNKLLAGLRMTGSVATNFKAMNAQAIYERYCPRNGYIFDFAAGFGGRMLGALTSKKNFRYLAVEPNTETFNNLHVLGDLIEEVTEKKDIFTLYKMGSEDLKLENSMFDFAFSSPPYFSLEHYCSEETQCYIKFPNLEDWFDGYVRPTIENIYYMLKPGAYYAVNIADFKFNSKSIKYVDKWVEISKECGFEYVEQIYMKLQVRTGTKRAVDKKEGIFVFRKPVRILWYKQEKLLK
jgi:hypothetical protein